MTTSGKLVSTSPRGAFFTGREAFLQTLRETLLRERMAIVTGPNGVGKTAVVREYVRRFSQQYRRVLWINAATPETFLYDTLELAQRFSLSVDGVQGFSDALQLVQKWSLNEQDALLVLDTVMFPLEAQSITEAPGIKSHVSMTTGEADTVPALFCLKLAPLDERDGALLVLRQAGLLSPTSTLDQAGDEQCARAVELARELHGLPLALKLAGGYLRATASSIEGYLFSYRDCPVPLHHADSLSDEDAQIIEVVCELTLAYLAQAPSAALEILRACALLLPDAIPLALLEQQAVQGIPESQKQESVSLLGPIKTLLTCGLLAVDEERPVLHIHPLVQSMVRRTLSRDEQQQRIEQMLRACQQFLLSEAEGALFSRLRVAGHIRHLAAQSDLWTLSDDEAAAALNQAASLLWGQGLVREAEELVRKALAVWERTSPHPRPETATALLNLAVLNALLKRYAQAEEMAQRAVMTTSQALGVNHPDVLLTLNILGDIYMQQSKHQQARLCYKQALSIGDRVGLQQHAFYLTSLYELSLLDIEESQLDEAQAGLEKVCAGWEHSEPERYKVARIHLERLQARKTATVKYRGYDSRELQS